MGPPCIMRSARGGMFWALFMHLSTISHEEATGRMVRITAMALVGLAISLGAPYCPIASAQEVLPCGDVFRNAYGPFDYRTASADNKYLVEGVHFTSDIENFRKNGKASFVANDIDYTLRVFPNHPRALMALSKLSLQLKSMRPPGTQWTVDCYFQRAIRYRADDSAVRLVYGIHLTRWGKKDAARQQLDMAEKAPVEDGNFHYNLGLAFLDVGEADRALKHAKRAYALGYQLPGLRNRLEKLGKWRDGE
jgi:hypothetical protein